jgi:hypothetical protein
MSVDYLSAITAQIRKDAEEAARLNPPKLKPTGTHRGAYTPLDQQITDLMRTLPPARQIAPWSIDDLVARLDGKYRDRPHAKGVGEALRRLGWQHVRLWAKEHGGRRYWVAPSMTFV